MDDKQKIAIVVVGYNRLDSIQRLLGSLLKAKYPETDIPLCISIDASGCEELYEYVRQFEWPFGEKYVNIQQERLGLRNHIIKCGDFTQRFKGIILLEDDIYVSEYFYQYVLDVVDYYYDDERIAGFSLYKNEVANPHMLQVTTMNDGSDCFLRQSVASWGQCWTDKQWKGFRQWYDNLEDESLNDVDMPLMVKSWKKAWSKFYIAYEIVNGKYFVFPNVSHTTCFSDAGENNSENSNIGQANLLCGPKIYNFRPFEELVKYDNYGCNTGLYKWLGLSKEEVCLNINGNNLNVGKKRYMLSTYPLPYKVVKEYGLKMRPIELNVKDNIPGTGLFLYDTTVKDCQRGTGPTVARISYDLRGLSYRLLVKYLWFYFKNALRRKCKSFFKRKK